MTAPVPDDAGRTAARSPGVPPAGVPLVFLVNSGRCGSTVLSAALRIHPRILSLSEFFRCIGSGAFEEGRFDNKHFWQLIARPRPHMTAILRYHVEPAEVLYPVDNNLRFNRETGVPPIALIALPHLTDGPDALLDEIFRFVMQLPEQTLPDHFRALFAWLCARFQREVVVERSGASLANVPSLIRGFPEARFIHLYRDGRGVAVSMSRHSIFRLWLTAVSIAGSGSPDAILDELGAVVLSKSLPDVTALAEMSLDTRIDVLQQAMGVPPGRRDHPTWRFGILWSSMIRSGMTALSAVDPRQVTSIDFDEVLIRPESMFKRIDRYLLGAQAPDIDGWARRAAKLLGPNQARWDSGLSQAELRRLELACRSGLRLIRDSSATMGTGGPGAVPTARSQVAAARTRRTEREL